MQIDRKRPASDCRHFGRVVIIFFLARAIASHNAHSEKFPATDLASSLTRERAARGWRSLSGFIQLGERGGGVSLESKL
jgi:hypothetical protein